MRKTMKNVWKCTAAVVSAASLLCSCSRTTDVSDTSAAENKTVALKPEEVDFEADDYDSWNQLMEENQISGDFQEALSQFAYQSASRVLADGDGNINYSPLSLYYALAMAGSGAEGETVAQIGSMIGIQDQGLVSEQCRKLTQGIYYYGQRRKKLYEQYGEGSYDSAIRLGNSLWISHQLKAKEDYLELAAERFFAPSFQVDFTEQEAGERIGRWVSEQTNGVLQPVLQLDTDTMVVILNTLYFYGGWQDAFSPEKTVDDSFTKADQGKVSCPFMNRVDSMGRFKKGEGYTVSALRTNNGCSMVFMLPDQGRSAEEFLNTPEGIEEALGSNQDQWQSGEVTWKVPKFSFGSSLKLSGLLKGMGVEKMFLPEEAELGKLSEYPLYVSEVIQENHIGIDEKGVEGAAYTMMAVAAGASMPEEKQKADMILDRPFIYGIQEDRTGAWLFIGVCRDPADGR